ncbi:7038_t:CDS:1, partial [Ambispora gerdemannii]
MTSAEIIKLIVQLNDGIAQIGQLGLETLANISSPATPKSRSN